LINSILSRKGAGRLQLFFQKNTQKHLALVPEEKPGAMLIWREKKRFVYRCFSENGFENRRAKGVKTNLYRCVFIK